MKADSIEISRFPTSPGELIKNDVLPSIDMTQEQFAEALGVSRLTVNQIINGRRAITAETALRLGKFLGTTPEFWLGLQNAIDLFEARKKISAELVAISKA